MPARKTLRKLVLFYSNTGGTRYIAQTIANTVGADVAEIKTLKPVSTFMPWLSFWGGFQVMTRHKPKIQPLLKKPETYDLIYIGTPIWASRFAPALRTWLTKVGHKGKRLALFASGSGGKPGRTFTELRAALPDNTYSVDLIVQNPLKDKTASARLARDWARQVLKG